jgi:hypothetical protein
VAVFPRARPRPTWRGRRTLPRKDTLVHAESEEQAVLAHLKLSDDEFGSEDERETVFDLEDQLIEAIQKAGAGEFDGNEFGEGYCRLFMYGRDANALFDAVIDTLRASAPHPGSYVVKRYGPPGATEERVDL